MGGNRKKGKSKSKAKSNQNEKVISMLVKQVQMLKFQVEFFKNNGVSGVQPIHFTHNTQSSNHQKPLNQIKNPEIPNNTDKSDKMIYKYEQQILKGFSLSNADLQKTINKCLKRLCSSIKNHQNQNCYKYLYRLLCNFQQIIEDNEQSSEQGSDNSTVQKTTYSNINSQAQQEQYFNKFSGMKKSTSFHHIAKNRQKKIKPRQKQSKQSKQDIKQKYMKLQQTFEYSKQVYQSIKQQSIQLKKRCQYYEKLMEKNHQQNATLIKELQYHKIQIQSQKNQYKQLQKMYRDITIELREYRDKIQYQINK